MYLYIYLLNLQYFIILKFIQIFYETLIQRCSLRFSFIFLQSYFDIFSIYIRVLHIYKHNKPSFTDTGHFRNQQAKTTKIRFLGLKKPKKTASPRCSVQTDVILFRFVSYLQLTLYYSGFHFFRI